MSVLSTIRKKFKDLFGGSGGSTTRKAKTVSNYGGGGSRSVRGYSSSVEARYQKREDEEKRRRQELKRKQQERTDALAQISKNTDALSSGKKLSTANRISSTTGTLTTGSGTSRVLQKINEKSKATPPDPKQRRLENSKTLNQIATETKKQIENDRASFNKATGNKYNANTGNKTHDKQAQLAQKMQAYDPNVERWNIEHHPNIESAGRGAVSGLTFGGSELMLQRSKNRQKTGMEQYYQENKNVWAERGGEIAGSLVGFGLTEKAATKIGAKIAPQFLKRGGARTVEWLVNNPAFRKAARKEAERTGIKVTEEVLERFARQRAERLVEAVGSDMAVNWTTGGMMDVTSALRDGVDENGNRDWGETLKSYGLNRALNYTLGGAVTVAPALRKSKGVFNLRARDDAVDLVNLMRGEKGFDDLVRGVRQTEVNNPLTPIKLSSKENLRNELGNLVRRNDTPIATAGRTTKDALSAPRIGESMDNTIARRTNQAELPNNSEELANARQAMREAFVRDADEARRVDMGEILAARQANLDAEVDANFDAMVESATTVEDFQNLGLPRAVAEILANDKARKGRSAVAEAVEKEVAQDIENVTRNGNAIPKGNIKPLAENLRTNEFLTRSGNAQYTAAPRSVRRVDTSIDGLTRQLDDLKGQTASTDKERRAIETKINDVTDRLNRAKWRREGGADMEAMQKAYRSEYAGFDMNKSTNSYQSDALEGKIKGKTATIVEMSPDEYIERTYRQIFKKPSERATAFGNIAETQKNVERYAEAMRNGEKFPLPYLDYSAAQQEGRHRALAAKAAGIDKIPVVIIDNEANPKAIINEVAEATAKADGATKAVSDAEARISRLENNSELYRGDWEMNRNELSLDKYIENERKLAEAYREIGDEESAKVAERNVKKFSKKPTSKPAKAEPPVKPEPKKAEPPRAAEEEFPYEGTPEAEDMMRKISEGKEKNAEPQLNEREALEKRVKEIADEPPRSEEDEPLRVNKVAEDKPIGGTTRGEQMAHSAYHRNTGEEVDKGIKSSWHEAWKASQEYHESHAAGHDNRLSKTSVSQLHMMSSDAERAMREKGIEEGWLGYNVIHTEEMLDKVSKEFRDDPNRWVSEMIDVNNGKTLDFRTTPEWQARAHYIMAVVDPSADEASEIAYTEAYKLATAMSSKAGQTNILRKQFVHLTPMGKRDSIMNEMADILYNSAGFAKNHPDMPKDKYDALAYIKAELQKDPEIEKRVQKLVEVGGLARDAEYGLDVGAETAAKNATDGLAAVDEALPTGKASKTASKAAKNADELMEAHADLLIALNKKNPKTLYDVLQEIRYLNMLGNPKTHIRNIFGSGFFSPIRQISNMLRSGIENSSYIKNLETAKGMEVTKHGGLSYTAVRDAWAKEPKSEAGKKALEAFNRNKPELLGSLKLDNQLYKGRATTKVGKVLDAVSDFNSHLLSGEDDFFKQKAFRENYIKSYEAYRKRGVPITKKIEKKIEAEAMQEAQIATFNEYNEFANALAKITKAASDPNASVGKRWVGRGVNAIMPFTKVPANIMKQSINYSPVGIAKGVSTLRTAVKRGDSEMLNRAIDELASGGTGTIIFGLGMLLGRTSDAWTTNAGKDDAAAKFKKQQGVQNYSVMFKDPISGKTYSMTLDWLVPNSATFFAGVELANQMRKGDFDVLDLGGDWAQILSRIVEPVMETSMLSGLYSVLESSRNSYGDDDKNSAATIMIRETVQSYLNSLAPTSLGQLSRTLYKNDKQITGDDDWEYWRNQMKSKMGLGETNILGEELGADTTAYGDVKGEKNSAGDYIKSGLKNFLSPANIQEVDLDEVDEAKIKQYEDAVKNGADPQEMAYLFPKKQYKKQFTTGNLDVKLSNKDLSTYNQAKTTGGSEGARYALESIMFNRYTKDENGNKQSTADAYTPEQKAQIIKQFEGKSIREVEAWVREQPQFKNATEAEQKKVIDGLWSYSKQGKAQSAKRVGEQAVIEAQGGDVNEYNFNNEITEKKREALQPYIDQGLITYEDAVDFARLAGKTYYYEDDEGGHSQTYYNKGVMMEYLKSKGFTDEQAAALFNSFKASNAKEYGSSSGRRGYRRGGYRRRGHGSSKKATVPTPKTIKASSFTQGQALVSKKGKTSATSKAATNLTRVKAKIDLPEAKW